MWVTAWGVLGSWLSLVSADPWTGFGSFYTYNAKKIVSDGLISERAYYDPLLKKTIPWRNYYNLLMSPNVENYPSFLMGNKSIVMIGDSTEHRLLHASCNYLISKAKSNTTFHVTLDTLPNTTFSRCQIRNGISSLMITHIRHFGFKYDPQVDDSIIKNHQVTEIKTERILRKYLQSHVLGIPGAPDYVTLQSCLWDLNEREGIEKGGPLKHYKVYPSILHEYYDNAAYITRLLRQLLPDSILIFNTCKPVNDNSAKLQPSRENHMQVELDGMIRLLASRGWEMDDIVDNGALLKGYEQYASDGKHYKGLGAQTILNAFLNAFEKVANDGNRSKTKL